MLDAIRALPIGWTIAVLYVIVFLRANATYWIGRAIRHQGGRMQWARRYLESGAMCTAERFSARFGVYAIALSFLTIGIQTAVNMSAGALRMPYRRYLPGLCVGCLAWAILYGTIGLAVFQAIVLGMLGSPYVFVPLGIVAVIAGAWWGGRRRLRPITSPDGVDEGLGRTDDAGQAEPIHRTGTHEESGALER